MPSSPSMTIHSFQMPSCLSNSSEGCDQDPLQSQDCAPLSQCVRLSNSVNIIPVWSAVCLTHCVQSWCCVSRCPMLAWCLTLSHTGIVSHFVPCWHCLTLSHAGIVSHFVPCWHCVFVLHWNCLYPMLALCPTLSCTGIASTVVHGLIFVPFCKSCVCMYIYRPIPMLSAFHWNNLLVLADIFTLFNIAVCFLCILSDARWSCFGQTPESLYGDCLFYTCTVDICVGF